MTTDARDARSLPEEGFHEIQLSGKQLVFLFMATTVVSVVIFLCGVLVGRGVRTGAADAAPVADAPAQAVAAQTPSAVATPAPDAPAEATGTPGATNPAGAAGKPGDPGVDYPEQLTSARGPSETLAPAKPSEKPAEPKAAVPPAAAAAASTPSTSDDGSGYLVQVSAVKKRTEADSVAKRLSKKGYKAFVTPSSGRASLYRVRVGPYADKAEAERIVKKLSQEERLKPWIIR